MAKIILEIAVSDMKQSLEFYNALGFTKGSDGVIDDKGSQWSSLLMGDAELWITREDIVQDFDPDEERGNGVNIYLTVDNVDATYEKIEMNATIVKDIETMYYGLRQFSVVDPDGYLLTINMQVPSAESSESVHAEN